MFLVFLSLHSCYIFYHVQYSELKHLSLSYHAVSLKCLRIIAFHLLQNRQWSSSTRPKSYFSHKVINLLFLYDHHQQDIDQLFSFGHHQQQDPDHSFSKNVKINIIKILAFVILWSSSTRFTSQFFSYDQNQEDSNHRFFLMVVINKIQIIAFHIWLS